MYKQSNKNKAEGHALVELLREHKEEQELTFAELARGIGIQPGAIQKWFAGDYLPSLLARPLIVFYLKKYGKKIT